MKGLELISNQLSGSIPAQLGDLANLQGLYLYSNQLSGSIPTWLGDLTNLQTLSLSSNQLSGSIPAQLGNLTSLWWLDLGYNQLSGALPRSLMNLAELDWFRFDGTDLCEPGDADFQAWLAGISTISTGVICEVSQPIILVHGFQGMPGSDTRRCSEGVIRLAPGVDTLRACLRSYVMLHFYR